MSRGLLAVDDRDFDRVVAAATVPVLVQFWKPGCGHCHALRGELEGVQEHLGSSVLILAMNVEENHQIAAELEITSLPALALYERGVFSRFIGGVGKKEEILRQLQALREREESNL
jgi:thioredoxin 1